MSTLYVMDVLKEEYGNDWDLDGQGHEIGPRCHADIINEDCVDIVLDYAENVAGTDNGNGIKILAKEKRGENYLVTVEEDSSTSPIRITFEVYPQFVMG